MPDQIIDALMARSLFKDATRAHLLVAWVVMQVSQAMAARLIARLVTDAPTAYVLVGGSLSALRTQIPPGLDRTSSEPGDSPELIETWS